ncbi:MAG TPA: Rieske 2Fe-2S domain-containing protein [Bacteroidota bacterium]|nr:Rieske 2Fe-2S domain-containing protein [Bacteroidota bacterium]
METPSESKPSSESANLAAPGASGSQPSQAEPTKSAGPPAAPSQPQKTAPSPQKPAAAPAVKKPKQDRPPENDQGIWRISRRNFFSVAGWAAFFVFLGTSTIGTLRMMFPRILYEPPSAFKAGFPQDYLVGEVSEKYKDQYRVWIIREPDGFYALSAICTHLGCTPRWLEAENKFKCPCHGSGFHKSGINFEGPAPRPLERLKITFADDGELLVDRNIKFLFEKGEWNNPDAFLRYS